MPVATYLKEKQKKIESKYHQVAKQFESKYELIHRKVTSRFHREVPEIELVRSSLNDLIAKSTASVERKIKSKSKISIFSQTSTKKELTLIKKILIGHEVDSQDKQYKSL